ncbi:hypothetical protein ACVWYK_003413 [Bradyrhizobium sp. USDA 4470]
MRWRKANRPSRQTPHARNVLARNDGFAADVVGDVGEIDAGQLALAAGERQTLIDRWVLHEAIMQNHAGDAGNDLDDLDPVLVGDVGQLLDQHGDEDDALVQHVIVLDELRQRQRHAFRRGGQEHGGAGQARAAFVDRRLDQILLRLPQLRACGFNELHAAAPGQHQEGDEAREQQRKPAPLEQLDRIGREEDHVDHEEEAVHGHHDPR